MSEFKFMVPNKINMNQTSSNRMMFKINQRYDYVKSPSIIEFILLVWVVSFIIEEIRQVNIIDLHYNLTFIIFQIFLCLLCKVFS